MTHSALRSVSARCVPALALAASLGSGCAPSEGPVSEEAAAEGPFVVRARLLDLDGEPLDSHQLTFYAAPYAGAPAFRDGQPLTVKDGAFQFVRDPDRGLPDPGWWVLGDWRDSGLRGVFEIPVPPGRAAGETDLGELRMVEAPPLAAGRVLDASGAPLVLQAEAPLLSGRLLCSPGFPPRLVNMAASPGYGRIHADGSFEVYPDRSPSPHEPVEASISVSVGGQDEPVWVEHFPAGAPLPTSLEIDLRHLRLLEVELVDIKGEPIPRAVVQLLGPAGLGEGLGEQPGFVPLDVEQANRWGQARFALVGTDRARLRVLRPGYRQLESEFQAPLARIVLVPAPTTRLEVLDLPVLDPDRATLSVYAVSEATEQGGFCAAEGLCHPDGGAIALDLELPTEGRWDLRWWLRYRSTPGAPWRDHLVQTEPQAFEVTRADSSFELRAPRAAIEAAVARLVE